MESSTSVEKTEADKMDFDVKENEVFKKVIFEPIRIGPVSTLDEMDCIVLQFQNKKLDTKLEEYQRIENELQQRIEQLEKRQSQDTIVLNVVNRYWNHLNDDVQTMLLEFDDECQNVADEIESEAALAFVKTLATCNESEVDDKLIKNVDMSTTALARIMQTYDRIFRKYDETVTALKSVSADEFTDCRPSAAEFDRLDGDREDDPSGNKPKKRSKFCDPRARDCASHSPDQAARLIVASEEGRDSAADSSNSKIAAIEQRSCVDDERVNSRLVVSKKSTPSPTCSKDEGFDEEEEEQPQRQKEEEGAAAECEKADESVRSAVAEIVARVAGAMESADGGDEAVAEEVHRIGDDIAGNESTMDGADKMKFDVELSADCADQKSDALDRAEGDCADIRHDNECLRAILDAFQAQRRKSSSNEQYIADALEFKEQEYERWKARIDDIEYENDKLKRRKSKIEHHLTEAKETLGKIKSRKRRREKSDSSSGATKKFEELEEELELQRKLASNRSQELESMRENYENNLDTIRELEKSLNALPEDVIEESAEYKCLQSQYSVLHNDTIQIKDQIEEYHAHIQTLNATFANKMEMTETEDLMTWRKLQTDLLQMQQVNSQLRREYQMLKIEFERNLVANEQTGPLNREMRHLLVRLQKHNKHLKHEAQRYKRKYKELNAELNLLSKQSYNESKFKLESEGGSSSDFEDNDYSLEKNYEFLDLGIKEESLDVKREKLQDLDHEENVEPTQNDRSVIAIAIKQESDVSSPESPPPMTSYLRHHNNIHAAASSSKICSKLTRKRRRDTIHECREVLSRSNKESPDFEDIEDMEDDNLFEDEYVSELRNQLKKAETEQKELKLLLDMYKSVNRDKREKIQLAVVEKKLKNEIEETKTQMRRILEIKRENRKKLADEDALRKIKYLEEQNFLLLRQINIHKQEEEALLSEMEVTNQAFEDMQEQNSRLIQQLREKDDANSKLMAERIKSNLLYKITREEKESLQALISATAKQLDSVTTVLNELEEKEQVYQMAINNVEKEINLRQQSSDFHRKKALEYAHHTSELKLNLEKYLADVKESKEHISEKSIYLNSENFKYNRLQEEVTILQRQLQRMKKMDPLETPDVVLVEQVREYKEMLTCQSCKVRRKDAVLSKCFHVFCWECLRTRYETRQRKCPKCNAAFGANDYHRLFFAS